MTKMKTIAQATIHELQLELITRRLNKGQNQIRELELALENTRKAQAGREVEFRRLCALVYQSSNPVDAELGRTVTIPQDSGPVPMAVYGTDVVIMVDGKAPTARQETRPTDNGAATPKDELKDEHWRYSRALQGTNGTNAGL